MPLDRDSLTAYANQLKKQDGYACLAKHCVAMAHEQANGETWVFDSVRHPDEVQFLKEQGINMVAIHVDLEERYKRIYNRQNPTDNVDFETFKQQDEKESQGKSAGQHIDTCLKQCPYTLDNSGTEDDLCQRIDQMIRKLSCR